MLLVPDLMVVRIGILVTLVEQGVVLFFEVIVVSTCDVVTKLEEPDLMILVTGTLVTLVEHSTLALMVLEL